MSFTISASPSVRDFNGGPFSASGIPNCLHSFATAALLSQCLLNNLKKLHLLADGLLETQLPTSTLEIVVARRLTSFHRPH